ncbi:MAG: anti-sigma F factor antagonist [Anaeroplasmataceae bacterium]
MGIRINMNISHHTIFARLIGELDESTINEVRNKISEMIKKYEIKNLVLNMKELEFMDSSGIGLILGRYEELKKRNGQIVLCSLNENIKRIIMLSGLVKICTLRESEESARWFLEDKKI